MQADGTFRTEGQPFNGQEEHLFSHARSLSFLTVLFLFAVDAICVFLACLVAVLLLFPGGSRESVLQHFADYLAYPVVFVALWFWVGAWQQLFASHRKDSLLFQWWEVLKAVLITLVLCGFAVAFFTRLRTDPRFLVSFGLGALVLISAFRIGLRLALWAARHRGLDPRRVLIVGANPRTAHLVKVLHSHPRYGYEIVGVLEDEPARLECLAGLAVPHVGKLDDLERVLIDKVIDEVHVCLPVRSFYETIQHIAHLCVGVGVSVRLIADLFPLRLATSRLHRIENIPMLSLSTTPESTAQLAFKRAVDILGSLGGLVVLSPALLVTAIAIKWDSPGPAFFLQERVGKNQRRFRIVKFRSMVADAEAQREDLEALNEADGPVFKIRQDPRITRVGRFIRKYSIDELPQLFNVLKGEMSLVGPRPPIPKEVAQYTWDQRRRLSVKPGMTGLWQVSGRSDVSFKEWVDLDLRYIDTWSVLEDFRILLKTFRVVIQGRGAA